MYCKNCGSKLESPDQSCPNCAKSAPRVRTDAAADPPRSVPTRRRRRGLRTLLVIAGLLAVSAAVVYFLLPGALRPYDLSVKATEKDYESAVRKLGYVKDASPETGEAQDYTCEYGEPKAADLTLSSEEITSFLTVNRPPYYAVKNVQVRVNDDGTLEAAATIDTDYVFNEILSGQYTREEARNALPMLGLLPDHVNVYFKASGGVRDNRLENLDIQSVGVMGITLPEGLVASGGAESFVESSVSSYLSKAAQKSGANCETAQLINGELVFKGQIPSSVARVAK